MSSRATLVGKGHSQSVTSIFISDMMGIRLEITQKNDLVLCFWQNLWASFGQHRGSCSEGVMSWQMLTLWCFLLQIILLFLQWTNSVWSRFTDTGTDGSMEQCIEPDTLGTLCLSRWGYVLVFITPLRFTEHKKIGSMLHSLHSSNSKSCNLHLKVQHFVLSTSGPI